MKMLRKYSEDPHHRIFSKIKKIESHKMLLIDHGSGLTLKETGPGFWDKKISDS